MAESGGDVMERLRGFCELNVEASGRLTKEAAMELIHKG